MPPADRPSILDLCCGTKSATAPFERAGWRVVTLDNDAYWQPDLLADVLTWRPGALHVDVVWASPPCTFFSRSDQRGLYPSELAPSLDLVQACVRVIAELAPSIWWIENVRGARRHFLPLLGPPATHLGSWWLWTNSPILPALGGRPVKTMSGYRKGARRRKRLAVHPSVAAAVYTATCAALGISVCPDAVSGRL